MGVGGGGCGVDVFYTISVQTPQLLKKKVAGKLNPCLPARQHLAARTQQFRLQRSSSATVLVWSRSDCGFHSYALLTASSPASDFGPFVHSNYFFPSPLPTHVKSGESESYSYVTVTIH